MSRVYMARVPTNIAFLKYWGKSDAKTQWPSNDSLSMTLDLYTETSAQYVEGPRHRLFFDGKELAPRSDFARKPLRHLDVLSESLGFKEKLLIRSRNEFPESCGIASSASGLGAITLASIACWTESGSFESLAKKAYTRERLAELARLGSGSACRSFWGGFVRWERGPSAQQQQVCQIFQESYWPLRDRIVVLSSERKTVSSTDGHRLAWTSPLFAQRLEILETRGSKIQEALERRDLSSLGPLLEEEALNMHEVMKHSRPPCLYLGGETLNFLDGLRSFRQREHLNCFFTLDAGPNVHLIYEEKDTKKLDPLTTGLKILDVSIGAGPQLSRKEGH